MTNPTSEHSQSVANFVLAARESETRSLEALLDTCRIIKDIGDLVHDLQRERGLTNVNLASGSECLMSDERANQVAQSRATELHLRSVLERHFLAAKGGPQSTGLLNGVAFVLQGLIELEYLRQQVDQKSVDATIMTRAFSRLIAGLLDVVNEAADTSGDPAVSRALVCMINFMQGKEFAGQERAWGAIGFARGHFDIELRQRLEHLQNVQAQVIALYEQFGESDSVGRWQQLEQQPFATELARLRAVIGGLHDNDRVAPELSEVWYSVTTARIDSMHEFEVQVINDVVRLCQQRLAVTQSEYQQQLKVVESLPEAKHQLSSLMLLDSNSVQQAVKPSQGMLSVGASPSPSMRSIYDLIREQNEHLLAVKSQLDEARKTLAERKLVEQAKGLLMKSLKLTEEQAYRRIQQRAMESNMRLAEVSQVLIDAARRAGGKPKS